MTKIRIRRSKRKTVNASLEIIITQRVADARSELQANNKLSNKRSNLIETDV